MGLILNYTMPRLNLTNDFTFYNDEEFYYQYDSIVEDCPLPFRESFRTREILKQGWDFRDHRYGMRVGSVVIWKFVDFIIENNIGKNYNVAFSYYTKRTNGIRDARYWWDKEFEGRYFDYIIDKDGNIQKNETRRKSNNVKLSKTEKRLNLERIQKEKRNRRIQVSIPITYCYKTKQEIIEKVDKEVELQRLRKRGFDENSFRGEEYHGRKNKRK